MLAIRREILERILGNARLIWGHNSRANFGNTSFREHFSGTQFGNVFWEPNLGPNFRNVFLYVLVLFQNQLGIIFTSEQIGISSNFHELSGHGWKLEKSSLVPVIPNCLNVNKIYCYRNENVSARSLEMSFLLMILLYSLVQPYCHT